MALPFLINRADFEDMRPQKSIKPVAPPVSVTSAPVAPASVGGKLTAAQLATLPLGWDVQNSLFGDLTGLRGNDPGVMAPWQSGGAGGVANESGQSADTSLGATPNYDALKGYTFDWQGGDKKSGTLKAYDSTGKAVGSWDQKPEQSLLGGLAEWAGLAGVGFGGLGLLGLGPLAAATGATAGAASSGATGATGLGAAGDVGLLAANGMTDAAIASAFPELATAGGLTGVGGAATGLGAGLLDSIPTMTADPLPAIESYVSANPVTMPQLMAGVPDVGAGLLQGLPTLTADPLPAIESYVSANPVTMPQLTAGIPEIAPAASAVPEVFNAAKDSQLASQQLGITGAQSAASATAPAAVDLGSLGGITPTASPMPLDTLRASELSGYSSNGAMPSSPAVPTNAGGLLSNLPSTVTDVASWMKDNPTLGRLVMGGLTSLLSSTGGSSSAAPARNIGPAVQWNSPIQRGLLTPVQQYAPPVQTRPAGLLAQGFQNDGAWRYLKG